MSAALDDTDALLAELREAGEAVAGERTQAAHDAAGFPEIGDDVTHYAPLASVDDFLKRFVYVSDSDEVFDVTALNPATATLARTNFENAYAHSWYEFTGPKGAVKTVKLAKSWLAHRARLTVHGKAYNPVIEAKVFKDGDRLWANTFWMPRWERRRVKKLEKAFLDHMALLVPDAKEREVVLDWFAHLLQYPGQRQRFALMMVASKQGTGRGWVVELMKRVLGAQNVKPFSMKEFDSDFDDAFIECLLNVVEEVRESTEGKYTLGERLKDRITMQSTVANIKYGAKKLTRIYSSLLMQSNHPDAIVVRDEDRRVMVVSTDALPRPDAYYVDLYDRLDDDAFIAAIAAFLLGRDLGAYRAMTRAPMTEAKQRMISATVSEADDVISTFLEECPEPFFTSKQVERYFETLRREGNDGLEAPHEKVLGAVLLRMSRRVGGLPDNAIKHKGTKVRPWEGPKARDVPKRGDLRVTVRRSLEGVDSWLNSRGFEALRARPLAVLGR